MIRKILGMLFMIGLALFMAAVWLQNYYFVSKPPVNGLVLEVWNKPPARKNKELKLWEETVLRFEQANPGIKIRGIERRFSPQEFVSAMAGGKGPDLMHVWVGSIPVLARNGFIAPMDDYLQNWDQREFIPANVWEPVMVDGVAYGVPRDTYFTVLFYRKDLFQTAGLNPQRPPQKWGEFVDYAVRLTNPSQGRFGLGLVPGSWYLLDFVGQLGGSMLRQNSSGRWEANLDSPQVIRSLEFWKQLRWQHRVLPPNTLPSSEEVAQMFALGKVAMMIGTANEIPNLLNKYGLDWRTTGIAPLPSGPQGFRSAHAGGDVYIINASLPQAKRDVAWRYIAFELSPLNQLWKWQRMNELKMPIFPGAFAASTNLLNAPAFQMVKEELKYVRNEPTLAQWILVKEELDRDPLQAILSDPDVAVPELMRAFNAEINRRYF